MVENDRGYSREELSEMERAELRRLLDSYRREGNEYQEMLEHHRRSRWLREWAHKLTLWIGAAAGAVVAAKTILTSYLSK